MTLVACCVLLRSHSASGCWAHRSRLGLRVINGFVSTMWSCVRSWGLRAAEVVRSAASCLRLELEMESRTSWSLSLLTSLRGWYQVLHLLNWCVASTMSAPLVTYSICRIWIWAWLMEYFGVRAKWTILTSWSFTLVMHICAWTTTEVTSSADCLNLSTISEIVE